MACHIVGAGREGESRAFTAVWVRATVEYSTWGTAQYLGGLVGITVANRVGRHGDITV